MNEVLAVVELDEEELKFLDDFRAALSEPVLEDRLHAIRAFRHLVTAERLADLFASERYAAEAGPQDYPFVRWAAESAAVRHEAIDYLTEIADRYKKGNERKLNVAEQLGLEIMFSVTDERYGGLYTKSGLIERLTHLAKKKGIRGAQDKDVVRKLWQKYRGVTHLGMADFTRKVAPDCNMHILEMAENYRQLLSTHCPRGTNEPYVPESEQIKFVNISRTKGPRYRNRGLPFFDE
ncbi:hypothetical protein [Tropicimonas sp. S265A]|uniref:hypothetical protein n=1 Tax=Tropicimonas sp. S265A TaxID=3415134 RepID=UPI003C7E8718